MTQTINELLPKMQQLSFKGWPVYESLPDGWVFDFKTGSPLAGHSFATNGKSMLNGGARALVKVTRPAPKEFVYAAPQIVEKTDYKPMGVDECLAMNELARAKFKEQLLKELSFDMRVCMIEGWDTAQYVAELHALINSVYESIKPAQGCLFGRAPA